MSTCSQEILTSPFHLNSSKTGVPSSEHVDIFNRSFVVPRFGVRLQVFSGSELVITGHWTSMPLMLWRLSRLQPSGQHLLWKNLFNHLDVQADFVRWRCQIVKYHRIDRLDRFWTILKPTITRYRNRIVVFLLFNVQTSSISINLMQDPFIPSKKKYTIRSSTETYEKMKFSKGSVWESFHGVYVHSDVMIRANVVRPRGPIVHDENHVLRTLGYRIDLPWHKHASPKNEHSDYVTLP